jgi:hypothetical protein
MFSVGQILASIPISAVLNANELGTAFPMRTLSAATARRADAITNGAANAPPTTPRLEINCI